MTADEQPVLKIGLRFDRGQAVRLQELAEALGQTDHLRSHASIFHQAAEAAAGPDGLLIVHCYDQVEALLIAAAFPRFGVAQPAIEDLGVA